MNLKIKKLHPDAKIPYYAKPGDAGLDLTAVTQDDLERTSGGRKIATYGTGLAVEIPPGHVGLIFPRSSICKTDLSLTNCVGVIDSGYRGEIKFKFAVHENSRPNQNIAYKLGDRIGQLVVVQIPTVNIQEVNELSETNRSDGGFGSTGK